MSDLAAAYYKDAGGNDVMSFLKGLSESYGKQIWISDKAFHSFDGAAADEARIFNPALPLTIDLEEQAKLYESFLQVMSKDGGDWLAGISFQNFNNIKDSSGILPRFLDGPMSESPQDKPAEAIMAAWYKGLRQAEGLSLNDGERGTRLDGGYHHDVLSGGLGDDTIAGYAGNDTLTGGPAVLGPSTAFWIEVDLRGVRGHDMVPTVRVRDAQGATVLTQAVEAPLSQSAQSQPTRIGFYVSDLSGFTLEQTNWAFFDMSETGNIFVRVEAVRVNGASLDLPKTLTYVPPMPFTAQLGRTDSVHGGKFTLDLRQVEASPITVQWTDNDVLAGGAGDDLLDGGAGLDTALFAGKMENFKVSANVAGFSVADNSMGEGTERLVNIERIRFADGALALDIEGVAGQAYRIYQAAFDRSPDLTGLGYWMSVMDQGSSLKAVAAGFVGSAEFRALYGGNPTNAEIVAKFYQNVLHRAGETEGIAYWAGVLDSGAASLVDVLIGFSESAENKAALVGLMSNGFAYTPFG